MNVVAPEDVERALSEGFEATVDRVLSNRTHDSRLRSGVHALLAAGKVLLATSV